MSALLALTVGILPAQAAANSFTTSVKIPVNIEQFVPCANGDAGEIVSLSGDLHHLVHVTSDNTVGVHVTSNDSLQSVHGTGLVTGDTYRGTGATVQHMNQRAAGFPATFTVVINSRIIGQGSTNNFLVHVNSHMTINANGSLTAAVSNVSVVCK